MDTSYVTMRADAQLLSSTYLGTSAFDQSYFVQLDSDDEVYVVGQTAGDLSCIARRLCESRSVRSSSIS